ncbi:MAG: hypothetical protein H0U49_06660 [Parachlamydiaceae bacterium]|nr:hypothetical protein [Parachlamydiaceae bacterium]
MISSISQFLLWDNAPLQIFLHSTPLSNLFVRLYQNKNSVSEFITSNDNSTFKLESYGIKRLNFQSYVKTGVLIQTAIAVAAFASCILCPPGSAAFCAGSYLCATFAAGAFSSNLWDKFLTSFGALTTHVTSNGVQTIVKGF